MLLVYFISIGLLVGLIIAGTAYSRTVKIIDKYSNKPCSLGWTGLELVSKCNSHFELGLSYSLTNKRLGDSYIPKKKVVILNEETAKGTSIASIAIASHEIGHAIQDKEKNFLLRLDMFLKRIYSIFKFLAMPIFIAGIVLLFIENMFNYGLILLACLVGIWLLSLITRLITIPMELGASKIAYNMLKDNHILTRAELKDAKKIMNAAGMTYVGALFINILNLFKSIRRSFR